MSDYSVWLWLLKLGALPNLYFLARSVALAGVMDPRIIVPAQILFAVSAYRCVFPLRYEDNVVFHDTPFSSTFLTRVLATFSEVAYIYLFSYVLRLLNTGGVGWVNLLSWWMVVQVVISQGCVWSAILAERLELYVYEELGWFIIFAINTIVSAYLYLTTAPTGHEILLVLNVIFGAGYLPWQLLHLRSLVVQARRSASKPPVSSPSLADTVARGVKRALYVRNRRVDAASWNGLIGLTWMSAYWALVIPPWAYFIVRILSHP